MIEGISNTPNWYSITKDIIIPLIGILVTLVLGTIIALLLKRKEEKAKIKSLLIDTYMTYLNKLTHFVNYESLNIEARVLGNIYYHFEDYFNPHANSSFQLKRIKERIEELNVQLSSLNEDDYNWSLCTYKFAFLLSKKRYNKNAQKLEDDIVYSLMDQSCKSFIDSLNAKIKTDQDVIKGMEGIGDEGIEQAITKIEKIVTENYIKYQRSIFEPYSNTIADVIDAY